MSRTTLFLTNKSQAVRLSKDVAFPKGVREVTVLRDGPRRVIRDRPKGLQVRFNEAAPGLCLSMVTAAELLCGPEKSARPAEGRRQVMDFTGRVELLDFDTDAAAHYGEIRATLERQGQIIGPYDLMIAGHARSRGLVVVTGNPGEFTRVNGLRCEDW